MLPVAVLEGASFGLRRLDIWQFAMVLEPSWLICASHQVSQVLSTGLGVFDASEWTLKAAVSTHNACAAISLAAP